MKKLKFWSFNRRNIPNNFTPTLIQLNLKVTQTLIQLNLTNNSLNTRFYWKLSSYLVHYGSSFVSGRYTYTPFNIPKFFKRDETYPFPTPNPYIVYHNENRHWSLFLQNWKLTRPKRSYLYNTNREFRLMFFSESGYKPFNALTSASRHFSRWLDSYNLLFNLFFVESQIQLFTNKLFIEEALVFNWNYNYRNYKLFKYTQPFFIFSDAPHGGYIHSAMSEILTQRLDMCILVDVRNHKRLLTYIQKYSLFSIGLIPTNYSPWMVSYALPTFSDSPLSQYYFLRFLFFIRSSAISSKFYTKESMWTYRQFVL